MLKNKIACVLLITVIICIFCKTSQKSNFINNAESKELNNLNIISYSKMMNLKGGANNCVMLGGCMPYRVCLNDTVWKPYRRCYEGGPDLCCVVTEYVSGCSGTKVSEEQFKGNHCGDPL